MAKIDTDFIEHELAQYLYEQESIIAPAADELREKVNEVIQSYKLSSQDVISMLARLSSAYVHLLKLQYSEPDTKDAVEYLYDKMYEFYLANYDAQDVNNEIENRKVN